MVAVVLIVNHPLVFSSKLQRHLLKAFLSELFNPAMGHFAQSIGVAARVVCKHTPLHLLLRTSQPFCDRDFPRPVVFFSILSKGKSTKVARAVKIASIRPTTKGSTWTGYWSSSRGIPWVLVINIIHPILSLASEVVLLHLLRQSRLSRDVSLTCVILLTVVSPSLMKV